MAMLLSTTKPEKSLVFNRMHFEEGTDWSGDLAASHCGDHPAEFIYPQVSCSARMQLDRTSIAQMGCATSIQGSSGCGYDRTLRGERAI